MNTKRILALVLALLMVFALTACGGNSEEIIEEEIQFEYVSGEQTGNNPTDNNPTDNNPTNNNPTNNNSTGNNPTGGVDLSKLKGTTVRYATWKDPAVNEDGPVIKSFESNYGIKVKIDLINEGDYVKKISGMIAAATPDNPNVPDVFFCTQTFPACIKVLQPVTNAKLDLNDTIWDKTFINYFSINGVPYLVNTVSNIWNETDMLFYNKNVLRAAGYSDPDTYIQTLIDQGKWNFDTLTTMMKNVKSLGAGYTPAYMSISAITCSTGANWLKYSNGKYTCGFDSTLYDVTKQVADWKQKGLVSTTFADMGNYFTTDKMAFAVTNAWGLKTTGFFGGIVGKKMDPNNVGFTYIPDMSTSHKTVATGITRGYGLIKGAANPLGAGVFLRYYLDVNNYDCSTAFISKKAEDFFFKVTTPERFSTQNFYTMESAGLGVENVMYMADSYSNYSPDQVESVMKGDIPQFTNIANQITKNIATDLEAR